MANELRLKRPGKMSIRMHIAILVVLLVASIAAGYAAGQYGLLGISQKSNCIPQEDFDYFLQQANGIQADYQKCVSDLWALEFSYKQQSIANAKMNAPAGNSTN